MLIRDLVEVANLLTQTPSTLDKIVILKQCIEHPLLIQYLAGEISITGVAEHTVLDAAQQLLRNATRELIENRVAETGDYGLVIKAVREELSQEPELITLEQLKHFIENLTILSGKIEKTQYLAGFYLRLSPNECCIVTNLLLGKMKTGVSDGNVIRAISEHYKAPEEKIRLAYASMTYSELIQKLREGGSLEELQYGVPFFPQLAQRGGVLGLVASRYEFKYDGLRCLAHIYFIHDVKMVRLFSRRGKEITAQFPELVHELLSFPPCIVDGEIVAIGRDGIALPFQNVLQRARRKYAIKQYVDIVPVKYYLFDIVKVGKETLIDIPFMERRHSLEDVYNEILDGVNIPESERHKRIFLAAGIETYEEVTEADKLELIAFLNKSISLGHEGLVIKGLNSTYSIGRRTVAWLKLKQTLPAFDLVITGAQYGEGKKAGYFSSYEVSALDAFTGMDGEIHQYHKVVGWVGTGVQDHEMVLLTERLKPLIQSQDGKLVKVKPEVVLEILAEEVQVSDKYESGIALRFPRVVAIRDDKRLGDITSLKEIRG